MADTFRCPPSRKDSYSIRHLTLHSTKEHVSRSSVPLSVDRLSGGIKRLAIGAGFSCRGLFRRGVSRGVHRRGPFLGFVLHGELPRISSPKSEGYLLFIQILSVELIQILIYINLENFATRYPLT